MQQSQVTAGLRPPGPVAQSAETSLKLGSVQSTAGMFPVRRLPWISKLMRLGRMSIPAAVSPPPNVLLLRCKISSIRSPPKSGSGPLSWFSSSLNFFKLVNLLISLGRKNWSLFEWRKSASKFPSSPIDDGTCPVIEFPSA